MNKTIQIPIYLNFSNNETIEDCEIPDTKNVPMSLILESLNNVTKWMAREVIKQAYGDIGINISKETLDGYLDAIIAADRVKLELLLKSK